MAYDASISTEVSLSRILDEMLVDSSVSGEVVISFLRQHENDIADIYGHSTMVYSLYDIMNTGYVDLFLVEHMDRLSLVDRFYAAATYIKWIENNGGDRSLNRLIREKCREAFTTYTPSRSYLCGTHYDNTIFAYETGLVEYLNGHMSDMRDVSNFIGCSYLARNAFEYRNFVLLSPMVQYNLIKGLVKESDGGNRYSSYLWGYRAPQRVKMSGYFLCTLLKQLLYMNDIELFNWVINVVDVETNGNMKDFVGGFLKERMPKSLVDAINGHQMGFEELVFEMNMWETQFDPIDMFLYIYALDKDMLKTMRENRELVEFFNLTFDWNELERMK